MKWSDVFNIGSLGRAKPGLPLPGYSEELDKRYKLVLQRLADMKSEIITVEQFKEIMRDCFQVYDIGEIK